MVQKTLPPSSQPIICINSNNRDFVIDIFPYLKEFAFFHFDSSLATDDFDLFSEITLVLPFRHSIQICFIYFFLVLNLPSQGVKFTFFSDSHLAPKFFKVVANSKKVGRHFQRRTKSFFTLSGF